MHDLGVSTNVQTLQINRALSHFRRIRVMRITESVGSLQSHCMLTGSVQCHIVQATWHVENIGDDAGNQLAVYA